MLNKLSLLLLVLILFPLSVYSQNEIDYFPQKAKKQNISLVVEDANITRNGNLNFKLNFYNKGNDTISLIKIDTSYVSASVMIIFIYENEIEIKNRFRIYLTNYADQLAGINIKRMMENLIILFPKEGFYQNFSVPFNAEKDKKYMIQIILDYDYIITSPIPLKNLVQQELKSNIIDVISN